MTDVGEQSELIQFNVPPVCFPVALPHNETLFHAEQGDRLSLIASL